MSLKVKCPKGCKLRVPNRRSGTVIRCPKCRAIIRVPSTEGMPKGGELITLKAELVSEAYSPGQAIESTQESLRDQWRSGLDADEGSFFSLPESHTGAPPSRFETPFRIDEPVLAEHHIDEAAVEHQHDEPPYPTANPTADDELVSGGYADPHPERQPTAETEQVDSTNAPTVRDSAVEIESSSSSSANKDLSHAAETTGPTVAESVSREPVSKPESAQLAASHDEAARDEAARGEQHREQHRTARLPQQRLASDASSADLPNESDAQDSADPKATKKSGTRSRQRVEPIHQQSEPPQKERSAAPASNADKTARGESTKQDKTHLGERAVDVNVGGDLNVAAQPENVPSPEIAKSDGTELLQDNPEITIEPEASPEASIEIATDDERESVTEVSLRREKPRTVSIDPKSAKRVEAHAQTELLSTQTSSDSPAATKPAVSPTTDVPERLDSPEPAAVLDSPKSLSPTSKKGVEGAVKNASPAAHSVEPPPLSSDETLAAPPPDEFVLVEPPIDAESLGRSEARQAEKKASSSAAASPTPAAIGEEAKASAKENRPLARVTAHHDISPENGEKISAASSLAAAVSRGDSDETPESVGLVPDFAKQQASRAMAMVMVMAGIFTMGPAIFDLAIRLQQGPLIDVERWVFVLFFLGGVHFLYALYLAQLPDWSSMWVISILMLVLTCFDALCLGGLFIGSADGPVARALQITTERRSQAMLWVLCMMSIHGLLSYFCGREASRWKSAFDVYISTLE